MTNATKRRAILFLVLAALITVLLAAALPQLELQKGVPLPRELSGADGAAQGAGGAALAININTLLQTVLGVFVVAAFIYYLIVRRQRPNWRETLRALLVIAGFSLVVTLLLYAFSNVTINMLPAAVEVMPLEVALPAGPELAPIPQSIYWLVWFGMAVLVLLLVISMARARITAPRAARDPLAQEAEQAIADLKAGQDFSNVIIRCYEQMSQVLKQEQGLTLEETMTAREFEALLEKRGIPNPPVRQLTRLFELARYAAQAPGPAEEAQAVDCLNAIARNSRKPAAEQPQ